MTIQLGNLVKDKMSGFSGIVSGRQEHLSGMIQFAVQPAASPKTPADHPDAISFDEYVLEVKGKGIAASLPPTDDTVTIMLGEEIEDIASGFRGIAHEKVTFSNGCVYFAIVSKTARDQNGKPTRIFLSHRQLKKVGNGLTVPADNLIVKATEAPARAPGGPSTRVERP